MDEQAQIDQVSTPSEEPPTNALTCSIAEASRILGQSYQWTLEQSKIKSPTMRLPGFKTGRAGYAVVVSELPAWLKRRSGLD